ncbi:MAG: AMP-binding protein [Planctomycetaceae bacterium]
MNEAPEVVSGFSELFFRHSEAELFLTDDGQRVSYAAVGGLADSGSFAGASRRLVLCFCDNKADSLLGYLACLCGNAIPLVVGSSITREQLGNLLQKYCPEFAWVPISRKDEIPNSRVLCNRGEFCLLKIDVSDGYEIHDSLALLLSTSGSTGSPRFVRLSHENIVSNATAIAEYLEITKDDIPITTLPPSYTYALSILHSHIIMGARIAITNQTFFNRGFWDFLKDSRATSFGGVPYHYEILRKLKFGRMDVPSLNTLTQAGGKMSPEVTRDFAVDCSQRGIRFFTMYGQAEATARMSYLPHYKAIEKAGSIGQAIPGGEFWLEDERGNQLDGVNETGELVYRGKNVCMGYAEGYRDLARGDDFAGVLHTGDLARRDVDGDYYIVGRKKRFLKIFGHRVNLQDVEDFLSRSGFQTACAGRDDLLEVYAVGVGDCDVQAIKQKAMGELKVGPGAVRVYGIAELPRNDAGKIQYGQLSSSGDFHA